jgi:hypothetical protein
MGTAHQNVGEALQRATLAVRQRVLARSSDSGRSPPHGFGGIRENGPVPTNVTPEFKKIQAEYRRARDPHERLALLR